MLTDIIKNEFRSLYRDHRFRVSAIVLCLLFLFSLYGSYAHYLDLKRQHEYAKKIAREHWENQGAKNPHSAAHYGTYVFKPVHPLSYFNRGISAYTGNTLFLEAHKMNEAQYSAIADQNELTRWGVLSPDFILGILFPLLILVFGFASIASEVESGNTRLLLAQGLKPIKWVLGKAIGLWSWILILALPFFLLGSTGLLLAKANSGDWLRYGLMSTSYLLYFGCFIHLSLLISAWSKKQNTALVASLGVWILICLVVPKATVNVAAWLYPTPAWQTYRNNIQTDIENGVDGHDPADEYTKKLERKTLAEYGVDSVHQLPFNWDGYIMQKGEEHETHVFQKHKNILLDIYTQQRQVQEKASLFSPHLLISIAAGYLSGTDVKSYFDFLAAAEKYRIELVGELNQDLTDHFEYGDWSGTRDNAFFASNKKFEYQQPETAVVIGEASSSILLLLIWCVGSAMLMVFSFSKIKLV